MNGSRRLQAVRLKAGEIRCNDVLGKSPLAYFQDLRVERAVHLLRTSSDSVDSIAAAVGYSDAVALRNLLRRKLGRGVRDIRAGRDPISV